jgi:Nitrile hydratase beta subunit
VTASTLELDVAGPAAPPRSNGELVFAEPWEGRAFGLTMALAERGVLSYETFRAVLIERIAA